MNKPKSFEEYLLLSDEEKKALWERECRKARPSPTEQTPKGKETNKCT
jgi:hypothetical protein